MVSAHLRHLLSVNLLLVLSSGCAQLQPRPQLIEELAMVPVDDAPLDRATAVPEAAHPGQSAFRLVIEGTEAFVVRVHGARLARRSLDVQSYIWRADTTGLYFVYELLVAADRGVRVRLLLDDMDARRNNDMMAALAAHPNIHLRTFNPFASRRGMLGFAAEAISSFKRINRRMHNKSWIADNRLAIVGGRNVGDEYFGASDEVNFIDLDFAMIGPVVREASAAFDAYWNSPFAYPMEVLDAEGVTAESLTRLRNELQLHVERAEQSRYALALRADAAIQRMIDGEWPMDWSSVYRFVFDDPGKVTMSKREINRTHVGGALLPVVQATRTRLSIISPYFVPGNDATTILASIARGGQDVRVLTNSLVANDVAAVHGGYSRYRKPLLDAGVRLWELKPLYGSQADSSFLGSSGASLHTKAIAVDGRTLFVGSYNLDPRSTWLNCEQGVLVESEALARQLERIFDRQTAGEHAWRVTIEAGRLRWDDSSERLGRDPGASLARRFQAWVARTFRLDAQL